MKTSSDFQQYGLDADPFVNLKTWLALAETQKLPEPTAMTLATADAKGRASARIVLYKGLSLDADGSPRGFRIFTNYQSRKSGDLQSNGSAALVFFWPQLSRQIRIEGRVSRLDEAESDVYFQSRLRGSQIGAWASPQSQPIPSREDLLARVQEVEARFAGKDVARPPNWGGWLLEPDYMEFWQAGEFRLHDRFVYSRNLDAQPSEWTITRLGP